MRTYHGNLYCSLPGGLFRAHAFETPATCNIHVAVTKSYCTVHWFIQANQKTSAKPLLVNIDVTPSIKCNILKQQKNTSFFIHLEFPGCRCFLCVSWWINIHRPAIYGLLVQLECFLCRLLSNKMSANILRLCKCRKHGALHGQSQCIAPLSSTLYSHCINPPWSKWVAIMSSPTGTCIKFRSY